MAIDGTDKKQFRQAVEGAVVWLSSLQNADGSVRPSERGPLAYYKLPRAFLAGGRCERAAALLDWAKGESFTDDGDFKSNSRPEFDIVHHVHLNCWLVWAAQLLGRYDLSYPGLHYILKSRDAKLGGYFASPPVNGRGEEDLLTTCFASQMGLSFRLVKEAKAAVQFLRRLVDLQPNSHHQFFLRVDNETGLVTRWDDPETSSYYVVEADEPQQAHGFICAAVAFLAQMHLVTGGRVELELASKLFDFLLRCHPDLFHLPSAGRMGWCSAFLFQITGRPKYLSALTMSADQILDSQLPAGYWLTDGRPDISLTAELCVRLSEMLSVIWDRFQEPGPEDVAGLS